MGGNSRRPLIRQPRSGGVSRALWPVKSRRTVQTGRAAQGRRLLIMKGSPWSNASVRSRHRCAYCNCTVEYVSYVRVARRVRRVQPSLLLQLFSFLLITALLAVGVSLTLLIVHHWSLVILLALVWIGTAYITSHLLANDMRSLRRVGLFFRSLLISLSLRLATIVLKLSDWLQATHQKRPEEPARKVTLPLSFPETPMPATPLIRVLETIDLSSTEVEHFLEEEERQTSGMLPVVEEPTARIDSTMRNDVL